MDPRVGWSAAEQLARAPDERPRIVRAASGTTCGGLGGLAPIAS